MSEDTLAIMDLTRNISADWYAHKIRYPWLLPGFNKYLSRMPNDFWDRTPHHTNLVETAHAGTNRSTQINLRPLEAIQRCVARTTYLHMLNILKHPIEQELLMLR